MAHNLARWTARIGLGEQLVTTKSDDASSPSPDLTRSALPPHFASSPENQWSRAVAPRSNSTPSLTAPLDQKADDYPTASQTCARRSPSVSCAHYPAISPSIATAGRHHRTSRRPHPHLLESGLPRSPSHPWCQRHGPSHPPRRLGDAPCGASELPSTGRKCPPIDRGLPVETG